MKTKNIQKNFKRIEMKYLLDEDVVKSIFKDLKEHIVADEYHKSSITNVYFDTDDFQMIKNAIAKIGAREKIRVRIYEKNPNPDSTAFLEIKKKINDIGYKFRTVSKLKNILNLINKDSKEINDEKLKEELAIIKENYPTIKPKMFIYYDRLSFKTLDNPNIRITLDQNLLYKEITNFSDFNHSGNNLVDKNKAIMEIKITDELPVWLKEILEKHNVAELSFSKYATSYLNLKKNKEAA